MENSPSETVISAEQIHEALKRAVSKELERKRRLGHFTVQYINNEIVLEGEDAPASVEELLRSTGHL